MLNKVFITTIPWTKTCPRVCSGSEKTMPIHNNCKIIFLKTHKMNILKNKEKVNFFFEAGESNICICKLCNITRKQDIQILFLIFIRRIRTGKSYFLNAQQ